MPAVRPARAMTATGIVGGESPEMKTAIWMLPGRASIMACLSLTILVSNIGLPLTASAQIDLAPIFQPPSELEIATIQADWQSRNPVGQDWEVVRTEVVENGTQRIYGLVEHPREARDRRELLDLDVGDSGDDLLRRLLDLRPLGNGTRRARRPRRSAADDLPDDLWWLESITRIVLS